MALVLGGPVLAACQPAPPPDPPHLRVAVVGDSLTNNITGQLQSQAATRHYDLRVQSFPGLALCGMVDAIRAEAARAPDVLVIESAGNANVFTPCAYIGGLVPSGQPYLDLYEADLTAVVASVHQLSPATRVVVAGIPPLIPPDKVDAYRVVADGPATKWASDRLNALYRRDAPTLGYAFADTGSAVAGPDGGWTDTMPCLPTEVCVGHTIDPARAAVGTNIVRSPDLLHFCPIQLSLASQPCPVYASGAFRYATAILDAVRVVAQQPVPTASTSTTIAPQTTTTTSTPTTEPTTTSTTEPEVTTTTVEPEVTTTTVGPDPTTTTDPTSP